VISVWVRARSVICSDVQTPEQPLRSGRSDRQRALAYGGSRARKEATGFGTAFFVRSMLAVKGTDFEGKRCVVSGSGNVAIYAMEKILSYGGKVVALLLIQVAISWTRAALIWSWSSRSKRSSVAVFPNMWNSRGAGCHYVKGGSIWDVPCEIALPCATQNRIERQ